MTGAVRVKVVAPSKAESKCISMMLAFVYVRVICGSQPGKEAVFWNNGNFAVWGLSLRLFTSRCDPQTYFWSQIWCWVSVDSPTGLNERGWRPKEAQHPWLSILTLLNSHLVLFWITLVGFFETWAYLRHSSHKDSMDTTSICLSPFTLHCPLMLSQWT